MLGLVAPLQIEQDNIAHTRHLERLVHLGTKFIAAHIIIVVHHKERLHHPVGTTLAVRRGITFYLDKPMTLDGIVEHADMMGSLLTQLRIGKDVEVIETIQLAAQSLHDGIIVFHLI